MKETGKFSHCKSWNQIILTFFLKDMNNQSSNWLIVTFLPTALKMTHGSIIKVVADGFSADQFTD